MLHQYMYSTHYTMTKPPSKQLVLIYARAMYVLFTS